MTEDKAIQISGEKAKSLRKRLVKTQAEMAAAIGMSLGGWRRIESAASTGLQLRNLRGIASAANTSVDEIARQLSPDHEAEPNGKPVEKASDGSLSPGGRGSLAGAVELLARSSRAEQIAAVKAVPKKDIKRLIDLLTDFVRVDGAADSHSPRRGINTPK